MHWTLIKKKARQGSCILIILSIVVQVDTNDIFTALYIVI